MASLAELQKSAEQYLAWEPHAAWREELQPLLDNEQELQQRFGQRIAFGTAGLRARMAAGYSSMNDLVVIQATQGFCAYLQEQLPADLLAKGVAIGYDGRHNSRRFAELATAVFLHKGVRVHLWDTLCCTPMIPYAISTMGLAAGIVVTASHNPKQDNGYKVYWSNGAQIIPPHDNGIASAIQENLEPWSASYLPLPADSPLVSSPREQVEPAYFQQIAADYCFRREQNPKSADKLRICYTAMHGVGATYVRRAFEAFALPPVVETAAQIDPDPEFPTVAFPNPEEGKGALKLAMETAEAQGCQLILANDPDADRLAVAWRRSTAADCEWSILNGNQIAILLSDWAWRTWREQNPEGDASKCLMLASTVSSRYLAAMAAVEGFQFQDTLTGFKWMGNKAAEGIANGMSVLFAYEVEIGFIIGSASLDKDGVRVAAAMGELVWDLVAKGVDPVDHIAALEAKYGAFRMAPSYYFCDSSAIMEAVFAGLRDPYPTQCGRFPIRSVRDVTRGTDSGAADGKSAFPVMADQQMLTFRFAADEGDDEWQAVITTRNSGTEPKLKYYVEASHKDGAEASAALRDELEAALIENFLQPEKFGLRKKK